MTVQANPQIHRLADLASLSYTRRIPAASDFLTPAEQEDAARFLQSEKNGVLAGMTAGLCGGYPDTERKCVIFLPYETGSAEEADTLTETFRSMFSMLRLEPASGRFARELSHRDYLGALIHTGIRREKLGDLLVRDRICHLICDRKIAAFLLQAPLQAAHEVLRVSLVSFEEMDWSPETEPVSGSVASLRMDAVVALLARIPRSRAAEKIHAEEVFAGGRAVLSADAPVKEGQVISIRGVGKFRITDTGHETKKGRIYLQARKYV